jgi:hypothetical protein
MEDRMSHYRGYFLKDDHIVAPAVIDASDDAQAMVMAGQLLLTTQFSCIEVWKEMRVIGAVSAPAPFREVADREEFHSSEDAGTKMLSSSASGR